MKIRQNQDWEELPEFEPNEKAHPQHERKSKAHQDQHLIRVTVVENRSVNSWEDPYDFIAVADAKGAHLIPRIDIQFPTWQNRWTTKISVNGEEFPVVAAWDSDSDDADKPTIKEFR